MSQGLRSTKYSRTASVVDSTGAVPTNSARAAALSDKGSTSSRIPTICAALPFSKQASTEKATVVHSTEKLGVVTPEEGLLASPVTTEECKSRYQMQSANTNTAQVFVNPGITREARNLFSINNDDGAITRPRIKLDINKVYMDKLVVSHIPKTMTRGYLQRIVHSFGEVERLDWDSARSECEVIYKDPVVARNACQRLDKMVVTGGTALSAHLRSSSPAAQLFVGDLIPAISEAKLESAFEEIVGSSVKVTLKRDPNTCSPIGYGFVNFESEDAACKALLNANRMKVGGTKIRVGRAERNCYLYVTDLSSQVTIEQLREVFSKHGNLVEEDTIIVRRSNLSLKFNDMHQAIMTKVILDKSGVGHNVTISDENCVPQVAVMFPSTVTRPPNSLYDLLVGVFSKYGSCTVEIPRLRGGKWRNFALIKFIGDISSARFAAVEAIQNVTHISQVRVYCDWAREIIPRVPMSLRSSKPARSYREAASKALMEAAAQNRNAAADANTNTTLPPKDEGVGNTPHNTPLKASAPAFIPEPRQDATSLAANTEFNSALSAGVIEATTPLPQKRVMFDPEFTDAPIESKLQFTFSPQGLPQDLSYCAPQCAPQAVPQGVPQGAPQTVPQGVSQGDNGAGASAKVDAEADTEQTPRSDVSIPDAYSPSPAKNNVEGTETATTADEYVRVRMSRHFLDCMRAYGGIPESWVISPTKPEKAQEKTNAASNNAPAPATAAASHPKKQW